MIAEVSSRSAEVYRDNDFSATATRQLWLPVGRYFFAVKADDGVRLVVNDRTLIDAWVDEAPTDYTASYEHRGGWDQQDELPDDNPEVAAQEPAEKVCLPDDDPRQAGPNPIHHGGQDPAPLIPLQGAD